MRVIAGFFLVFAAVAAPLGLALHAQSQSTASDIQTVWGGVYSETQAARGQTAYTSHCASCHLDDLSGYQNILRGDRDGAGARTATAGHGRRARGFRQAGARRGHRAADAVAGPCSRPAQGPQSGSARIPHSARRRQSHQRHLATDGCGRLQPVMRKSWTLRRYQSVFISFLFLLGATGTPAQQVQHYLYVGIPASDDAREDRSIRLLVFDIDRAHRFVKRIALWRAGAGDVETVRGIAAHAGTRRLFISTTRRLAAVDLSTEKVVWQKSYEDHCCDRFAVSPDGRTIYAPAFGGPKWYVINAATGELRTTVGAS